ncbi:unnamed protein product [Urochloa humidicola]
MQLTNRTDQFVAFKVKTTNPRKYSVKHSCGILLPRGSCNVTVTMHAPMEMLSDQHCKDKFLVQSVAVKDSATMKDFGPQLFTKAPGRVIEDFKLRVVYIAANPPSPVPEEDEEADSSPRSEVVCGVKSSSTFDAGTSPKSVLVGEREDAVDKHQKLVEEREDAVYKHQKLQQKMELLGEARSSQQGFSLMFVVFVFMSSVFIGHLMNEIKV